MHMRHMILGLAAIGLAAGSGLFAQGTKELDPNGKALRIVSVFEDGSYQVRYEDGSVAKITTDKDTDSDWPAFQAGDYAYALLDENGHARSLDTLVLRQGLGLTDYEISKSLVTKPEDLTDRFSYTYGYLLLRTLASQGLYFDVDYFVRGALDGIQAAQGRKIEEFFTPEEMNAEVESYQANIWSQGKAPSSYLGTSLEDLAAIAMLEKPTEEPGVFSYTYGYLMSSNMVLQGMEINAPFFSYGMLDAGLDNPTVLSEQEMQEAFMTYQSILIGQIVQRNHEKADTFFQENRGKEGVVTTDSGLQYQILVESDGAHPKATDKVKFHYILRDLEGNVLQNSHDAGEEAPTMAINGLVEGLVEGMPLMTVGSTWRFWLPSDLAYGDAGAGNDIEPGAAIQFDIQLVDIEPAEETRQN